MYNMMTMVWFPLLFRWTPPGHGRRYFLAQISLQNCDGWWSLLAIMGADEGLQPITHKEGQGDPFAGGMGAKPLIFLFR